MVTTRQVTPHVALDPGAAQQGMYSTMSNVFNNIYLNAGLVKVVFSIWLWFIQI